MCGIAGFTGSIDNREEIIKRMSDTIAHRGPDSEGVYSDEYISIGFRRLSFIDLADGTQPIYNEDKSLVVVLNGEIYNYRPLREELIAKGHHFYTQSDTEVLVHLYEECGPAMLDRLRGMFAFAIYNTQTKSLFIARDYFGIKPMYYAEMGGHLLFGSEIKSFLPFPRFRKELNEEALEDYLTFQYSVLDETFFKGVYKLPPAHFMIWKDGALHIERYWLPEFQANEKRSLSETVEAVDAAVQASIERHKISDVEVGSFLSSGVDSSYVAACFKGDKTFTVGFDYEKYNEIDYAKSLSGLVGIENHSKLITTEEYWDVLPKVQYHMDEPLADPAAVALFFVSQVASKHVKAALSGEGADEFFGGYNIYKEPLDIKILTDLPMPLRRVLGKLASWFPFNIRGKSFFMRGGQTVEERFIGNAKMFTMKERAKILKRPTGNYPPMALTKPFYDKAKQCDDITKMQYLDIHMWLVGDILLKADKMSMAHSLEVRVPYLDRDVFEMAASIPTRFRTNKTATKYAFRMAAAKHMPDNVADKKKLGFPVPIRIWLRDDKFYTKVKQAFTSEAAGKYFDTKALVAMLDTHKKNKQDLSRKIWTVYMFLVWHEAYFGDAA